MSEMSVDSERSPPVEPQMSHMQITVWIHVDASGGIIVIFAFVDRVIAY